MVSNIMIALFKNKGQMLVCYNCFCSVYLFVRYCVIQEKCADYLYASPRFTTNLKSFIETPAHYGATL